MSIDVIIPLFNGAPWIKETIDSVLKQDAKINDIIVVDDGSTDNSIEIVSSYPHVKLLKNPSKGSATARNFGLFNSGSPFVAFLDQDDVWHPHHLTLLLEVLQAHPEANTAFSNACHFEYGLPSYKLENNSIIPFDPWSRFPFTIGVDGPSLALIRRSTLENVGLWDKESTGMADALLFLKFGAIHPLLQLTNYTVGKRIHPDQQWLKVRSSGVAYLDLRIKVMKLALDFRRNLNLADSKIITYERRLNALNTIQEITRIIFTKDFIKIDPLGEKLERELQDDTQECLRHAFYCLMGALFPIHDVKLLQVERDKIFLKLLEYWPERASKTKNIIKSLIDETPIVS